jgi:hypothetical protein
MFEAIGRNTYRQSGGLGCRWSMDILLVEDNPGDARLAQEAFSHSSAPVTLHIVSDGEDAISFLRREGFTSTFHVRISSCWI